LAKTNFGFQKRQKELEKKRKKEEKLKKRQERSAVPPAMAPRPYRRQRTCIAAGIIARPSGDDGARNGCAESCDCGRTRRPGVRVRTRGVVAQGATRAPPCRSVWRLAHTTVYLFAYPRSGAGQSLPATSASSRAVDTSTRGGRAGGTGASNRGRAFLVRLGVAPGILVQRDADAAETGRHGSREGHGYSDQLCDAASTGCSALITFEADGSSVPAFRWACARRNVSSEPSPRVGRPVGADRHPGAADRRTTDRTAGCSAKPRGWGWRLSAPNSNQSRNLRMFSQPTVARSAEPWFRLSGCDAPIPSRRFRRTCHVPAAPQPGWGADSESFDSPELRTPMQVLTGRCLCEGEYRVKVSLARSSAAIAHVVVAGMVRVHIARPFKRRNFGGSGRGTPEKAYHSSRVHCQALLQCLQVEPHQYLRQRPDSNQHSL
jgi:hypothetical protein